MSESAPDDPVWLSALVDRSSFLPDASLRAHWRRLIPLLTTAARYELAATLLDGERWLVDDAQ